MNGIIRRSCVRSYHRGTSLIELMVVLSVSSTLLAVAIGWIHQSMSFGSTIQSRSSHHQALLRFAHQFREDTHHGVSVEAIAPSEISIRLQANSSVRYRVDGSNVTRLIHENQNVVNAETFAFTNGTTTTWNVDELPGFLGVVIERSSGLANGKSIPPNTGGNSNISTRPVELILGASVGRWHAGKFDKEATD